MENINKFLKEVIDFQDFTIQRAYELMMALDSKLEMYSTFDSIEFEEDGVIITFQENILHDCPDYKRVCLKTEELERTDEEWSAFIDQTKKETAEKEEKKRQREEKKRKHFESIKNELEY